MKIISWNVNGIRSVIKKGFIDFIKKENPDILCLQEIKAYPEQVDKILSNYEYYCNSAERKGYSGTAIFSKEKFPVKFGIGIKEHNNEGRVITMELSNYYLVNVYTPNSKRGLLRLDYRKKWDKDFLEYIKKLDIKKPVILCGDLNVAHTEIDLANPKSNYDKTAGYTQIEIDGFEKLLDLGLVDTFREFNKKPGNYTYWLPMFKSRERNVWWRIDYFIVSMKLMSKVKNSYILNQIMGSDHCPIVLEIE